MTDPPITVAGAPPQAGTGPRPTTRSDRHPMNWLLLIPILLPLLTFVYNRMDPHLGGFPFFYWFQLLFMPLAVVATTAVFLLTKKRKV